MGSVLCGKTTKKKKKGSQLKFREKSVKICTSIMRVIKKGSSLIGDRTHPIEHSLNNDMIMDNK